MRTEIPTDVAADILFRSDRTCVVCRTRGRPIQTHHLDDDPANHDPRNLAVLCLDCHRDTQIRGGFDRKLELYQIVRFRDDWYSRVARRRDTADEAYVQAVSSQPIRLESGGDADAPEAPPASTLSPADYVADRSPERVQALLEFINRLPEIRRKLYHAAQPEWDKGATNIVAQATYRLVDELKQLLIDLSVYFPKYLFDDPEAYFSARIEALYSWHWALEEPKGYQTAGTIVRIITAGQVMHDVEAMVVEMVRAATSSVEEFNFEGWRTAWEAAA